MTDVESRLAKKFAVWFLSVGAALIFAAGLWASDIRSRIANLEQSRLTREEAASLRNSIELLRQDIGFIRSQIAEKRPQ